MQIYKYFIKVVLIIMYFYSTSLFCCYYHLICDGVYIEKTRSEERVFSYLRYLVSDYASSTAAWAAARRAMGTRKGEQDT